VLRRGETIDWFRLLADLKRRGFSTREVARRLTALLRAIGQPPISEAHLRHYARGGEPRWPEGHALVTLWLEVTGTAVGDNYLQNVPKERRPARRRVASSQMRKK
jgi:hypothetical protein